MRIQGDAKRNQVIEGAKRAFLQEGFAGVSTDAIAREARISKRTLYSYYPSKEELFIAVIRHLTLENPQTRILDFMQEVNPLTADELRAALFIIAQKVSITMMCEEDLTLLRTIIADAHRFPQLTESVRATFPERAMKEIAQILERARTNGIPIHRGDTELLVRLFMGPILSYIMMDGLLKPAIPTQPPDSETLTILINLFMNAILLS
jgi:TetR/AcrR family transcriptional regulator, mexJK operon transcriptional repressor